MSMTVEEAIAIIEDVTWKDFGRHYGKIPVAREMAILALEEIQKYRAIGTVSEFRELKEKATAKKPRFYAHNYHCTECGNLVGNNEFEWQRFEYCDKCGQKLLWD